MAKKTNLFQSAVVVEKPKPIQKNVNDKLQHEIGNDLDMLAAMRAVINNLNTAATVYETAVREKVLDHFVDDVITTGQKPVNFRGIGKIAEASCEMRKRGTNSPLNADEISLLTQLGINTDDILTNSPRDEQFYFNPEVVINSKLADKISKALSSIPELKDKQILFKNEAVTPNYKTVVSSKSFDDAACITNPAELKKVFKIISTLAIKPVVNTQDMNVFFKMMSDASIINLPK